MLNMRKRGLDFDTYTYFTGRFHFCNSGIAPTDFIEVRETHKSASEDTKLNGQYRAFGIKETI